MGESRLWAPNPGISMKTCSNFDCESFQKLLANAFAVQQSQMDTRSLSAIVEVQRLITSGDFDVDGAIRLIADRTRTVANATGVAIGLLKGERLVYQAGSGSAATYIGRNVMATLSVPADTKAGSEILRVENAQTDPRIEAAICRQFGAESLLMLLIYRDRAVAGVLDILFSEAHHFDEREVRTYRLMAGLVGDALSHADLLEQRAVAAEASTVPHAIERIALQEHRDPQAPGEGRDVPEPTTQPADHDAPAFWQMPETSSIFVQRLKFVSFVRRLKFISVAERFKFRSRFPLYTPRWSVAVAAVVTGLLITSWMAYDRRPRNARLGASTWRTPSTVPTPPAMSPSKPQVELVGSKEISRQANTAKTTFKRVRVAENEVDYIADDVTVRYFTPKSAPQRRRTAYSQVNIGEDVTVRYFTPKTAVTPRPVAIAAPSIDHSLPAQEKSVSPKLLR